MDLKHQYFNNIKAMIDKIDQAESEKITRAAMQVAETTAAGGIIHLLGSGHSVLASLEVYIRAGAFSNSKPVIKDMDMDRFERIPGIGETLMRKFDGRPGEVMFIFSNSGKNALPIEAAKAAKNKGLFTIGVTSFEHGEKAHTDEVLKDVVDLAIDTHVPYGDASVSLPERDIKMAPLSTLANVTLLHAIYCEAAEKLIEMGLEPPIRISRNTPKGDGYNKKFIDLFGDRIPELRY